MMVFSALLDENAAAFPRRFPSVTLVNSQLTSHNCAAKEDSSAEIAASAASMLAIELA
jgi:hypothetical protein